MQDYSREWNIVSIARMLREDLTACKTNTEIDACRRSARSAMRALAESKVEAGQNLTPGEISVLAEHDLV